jgi:hypothetical protein
MKIRAESRGAHILRTSILLVIGVCLAVASFGGASGASPLNRTPTTDASPTGDIPDTQAFVAYTPADGRYSVQVPEGWARSDGASGVTFTEKLNSIRIEARPAASAPTVASVRANDVPALRSAARGFKLRKISIVQRKSGPAVSVAYRATSAPDPVTGKRIKQDVLVYEFWKAGTLVTITLSSPHGADNVDPWRKVTDSFAWSQ